ncbi:MAG: hypothetical protein ACJA0Q_001030 [Saprospiraceae bacterium]|jgi:hypothetical protein
MTVLDYDLAVTRLTELMNESMLQEREKIELESLLDSIDEYNSLEYLRAREN